MKYAILGDLHIGAGKRDEWTEQNQREFFFNFFFPKIKELGIQAVVQTGDFFDDRKALAHPSIQFAHEIITGDPNLHWDILVGNHDMHMKDVINPNAPQEILGGHLNVFVYSEPTTIDVGNGKKIDMLPWICKENREEIMQFVATSDSAYAVGHFELIGFKFYPGITAKHGDDPNFLKKYEKVLTGHYHTPTESDDGRIRYVGTPYTLNFNDANDARGFWVFDTDTAELEFYENPVCHHIKFDFDADTFEDNGESGSERQKAWINCINPINKKRKLNFDEILEKMSSDFYSVRVDYASDLQVIDDTIADMKGSTVSNKSSLAYVTDYIETLDTEEDTQERLQKIANDLYQQAQSEMNGDLS